MGEEVRHRRLGRWCARAATAALVGAAGLGMIAVAPAQAQPPAGGLGVILSSVLGSLDKLLGPGAPGASVHLGDSGTLYSYGAEVGFDVTYSCDSEIALPIAPQLFTTQKLDLTISEQVGHTIARADAPGQTFTYLCDGTSHTTRLYATATPGTVPFVDGVAEPIATFTVCDLGGCDTASDAPTHDVSF